MKKIAIKYALFIAAATFTFSACNDDSLSPVLQQEKDLEENTGTYEDLHTVMLGAYNFLQAPEYYGRDVIIFGEERSDNTFANGNSNRFVTVAEMNMLPTDGYANDSWTKIYQAIGNANIIINKQGALGDPQKLKHQKGEALVLRALAHFDLLRLYGQQFIAGQGGMQALGVPYVTTFRDNNALYPSRETVQENYDHIMKDLDEAITLMDPSLDDSSKHYFTSYAAHAIKARVANYFKDYATAETEAKIVIDSGKFSIPSAADFIKTFSQKSQPNVIFAVEMNANDNPGNNSLASIYRGEAYGDIVALEDLYNIYDPNDVRGDSIFIAPNGSIAGEYRNIGKYPKVATPDDDIPVIRYEEIVLIYAEALLNNGKSGQALTELNKIPAHRNAELYTSATMDNILLERRKELAFEGFRFDDLARTGKNMPLVDPLKQSFGEIEYGSYKYAFPIPQAEIAANSNVDQNEGYH